MPFGDHKFGSNPGRASKSRLLNCFTNAAAQNCTSWQWDFAGCYNSLAEMVPSDYPMIYVLDDKGVIRYKHEGLVGDELDEVVNNLLKEREAQTRADKK